MASGFWILEDGRGFSRRYSWMAEMLKRIVEELQHLEGANDFYEYLNYMVPNEHDEPNGHGGYIKASNGESAMIDFDLREFTAQNQNFFWSAAQKALKKCILLKIEENDGIIYLLTTLMDMNKRIDKKEDPALLNHLSTTMPYSGKKAGPGWQ
jgi:hypothetical protein